MREIVSPLGGFRSPFGGRAAGGAAVPTAFVAWYPADANTTRKMVPNSKSTEPLPTNILRFVNGYNYNFGGVNGATLTHSAVNGLHRATFAGGAATGLAAQSLGVRLAAGTYTLSVDYRIPSGAADPQTLRFGLSSDLATATVTGGTFATYSHTFTVAATGNVVLYFAFKDAANNAYDVEFQNIRLQAGAVALGVEQDNGHLLFGGSDLDTANPSFSDFTMGQRMALAKLNAPKTFTEFSAVAAVTITSSVPAGTPRPFVSGAAFASLNFGAINVGNLVTRFNGGTLTSEYANLLNRGWVIAAVRIRAGQQELYVNGTLVARSTSAFTGYTSDFLLHMFNGGAGEATLSGLGKVGPVVVYDKSLSDDELFAAQSAVRSRLIASGNTPGSYPYSAMFLGDSLTFDAGQVGAGGTGSHARRILTSRASTLSGGLLAVPSTGIDTVITSTTALLPSIRNSAQNNQPLICAAYIGVNDALVTTDPAAWYAKFLTLSDLIRDNGGKFIAMTVPPKNVSAHNIGRATVNDLIRGDATKYDALVNVDALSIGADNAPADRVFYYDDVHLNGAGYDVLTPAVEAQLDAVIASL